MRVRAWVRVRARTWHMHMHMHMHIHIHFHFHVHMHVHIHAHIHIHKQLHLHLHLRLRLHLHLHLHLRLHPLLGQGVHAIGTDDWALIRAKYLPHRDEAQLRDTWENKLCEHARERARTSELPLPPPPHIFGARAEPAAGSQRDGGGDAPSQVSLLRADDSHRSREGAATLSALEWRPSTGAEDEDEVEHWDSSDEEPAND